MNRFSLTSLRSQAILWTLVPLAIIFFIVASVGFYAYSEVVSRLVYDRDRELAATNAARLSDTMQRYAADLGALASHPFMRSDNFSSQKTILQASIENGLVTRFDGGITLLNGAGTPQITVGSVQVDINKYEMALLDFPQRSFRDEPFFQVPRDAGLPFPFFSNILDDVLAPRIIVSYPIFNEEGHFAGVLAGSFLLENETLGDEIRRLGVGQAYLVDQTGRVIWHTDPQFIGASFNDRAPVQALLAPARRVANYRASDEQGNDVVFGTAPVAETGWGLVIQEQWDTLISPVRYFQWIMFGSLFVGLLLVMVIISSGTSRVTEPIQDLVAQAQQLSQGEFVGNVGGGAIDEMRALSDAFNTMADRLARYRSGLQSYVAAITQSQEEERKRIARELHDDTVQSLIALGRRLELLGQSLENPMDAAKQIYQLEQMLSQTVAEVRQFSRDLRPLLLEDLGLEAAIRQMLREMERRDLLSASLTIAGEVPAGGLDDELEVTLYRIAQEALNNIRKHANATQVELTLVYEPSRVRLAVRDNGMGFSLAETDELARRGSFGLMGIQERANLFGGKFEVSAAPGQGARIEVSLPLTVAPEWVLQELHDVALAHAR